MAHYPVLSLITSLIVSQPRDGQTSGSSILKSQDLPGPLFFLVLDTLQR